MPICLAVPVTVTAAERHRLKKMAYGHKAPHQARQRATMVLLARMGPTDSRAFGRCGHSHDMSAACGLAFPDLGDEVPYRRESEVWAVTEDGVARAGKAHQPGGFRRQLAG